MRWSARARARTQHAAAQRPLRGSSAPSAAGESGRRCKRLLAELGVHRLAVFRRVRHRQLPQATPQPRQVCRRRPPLLPQQEQRRAGELAAPREPAEAAKQGGPGALQQVRGQLQRARLHARQVWPQRGDREEAVSRALLRELHPRARA